MSYITIKLRRGTAAQWTAQNPVLSEGEVGLETDTRKFKAGDGTTAWTGLQYYGGTGGGATLFTDLTDVPQSYSGQGGKLVRVKADASGLEFYTLTIAAGDLPSGIDAAKIANGNVSNAEFQYLDGVTSAIQTQINSKQASLGFTPEDVANKKINLADNSDTFYPTQKAVKTAVDAKQDALGFSPENVANKKTTLSDNSDTFYPTQKAVKTAVDAKQDALGFTAEDVANKSTSVTTDAASNTKYPSVKAVYDWAVATFTTTAAVAGQITTALSGYATQAFVTSQGYITNVITALGYTPENSANKKLNLTDNSDTFYPSQKAVKTAVDAKQDTLGYTAENSANKKTSLADNSDTFYPSQKAVKTAVDAKQDTLTLTTTGTSGQATLIGNTLNIPNYATGGGGAVDILEIQVFS